MLNRLIRYKLFYQISGLRGLILHLVGRFMPQSRFTRHATLSDFKLSGTEFALDVWEVLTTLGIRYTSEQAKQIEAEFASFTLNQQNFITSESFPHNWNSGESLRLLLFSYIRLVKPENVIETGTANGYSTSAMAYAFELNKSGKVHTFDILDSTAPYVLPSSRGYVELHKVKESPDDLYAVASTLQLDTERGFYFHDADHSYFGQFHDFENAKKLGFSCYFSDDVETSLVFCEQLSKDNSSVLFDGRKFIGATLI